MVFNYFTHVVILVFYLNTYQFFSIFFINFFRNICCKFFLRFKFFSIMIPQNIRQFCFFTIRINFIKEIETFISFCFFRHFISWKTIHNLCRNQTRIYQLSFCSSRMYALTFYLEKRSSCIKTLIFKLPNRSSIHRIRKISTKFFHIKIICTTTNFLIRSKRHFHSPMLNLRMLNQIFHRFNNLHNSSLIVSSQKCSSVSSNHCSPHIIFQIRKLLNRQHNILRFI